ncbi:MAG: Ribosomal RNA small subunit methyltransferase H [Saprospiraceae bacterium]|jgi:16S rRNA (cytosine1402-N4)-methyltransferase|nr:Ribosomal RNA small subunit methyltransferase H [Saprospiraceae bacterium]
MQVSRRIYLGIKMLESPDYRHRPVLLEQAVRYLVVDPQGTYADVTFGGGGHSRRILEALDEGGILYAFDRDRDVLNNLPGDPRLRFVLSDFRYLTKYLRYFKVDGLHGILADLGLSSFHLDVPGRGFSFQAGRDLDMRMNQRQKLKARNVVMEYPEEALARIFSEYGELTNARVMAASLVKERKQRAFNTCADLAQWAGAFAYGKHQQFLARVFQAIRIEVNDEISSLSALMLQSAESLRPGGRLVVISYHSLEDRLVKHWMRSGAPDGEPSMTPPFEPLLSKAIVPDDEELKLNPRSRSAKMRVAVRK